MSSILETFYILFETDASDTKKGVDEAKRATKGLESELSSADRAATKVGGYFLSLTKSAVGSLAAVAGAFATGAAFFSAVDYADKLEEASDALDANIGTLDAWGRSVALEGGTLDGFVDTLENLTAQMATVDTTGKSLLLPFFKELGVDMLDAAGNARPVLDLLPEIASAFEGLSKQEAFGFGKKLGLDRPTILLLQQGRHAVDDMIRRQKELGVTTQEDADKAEAFNKQITHTQSAFRSLFMTIGSAVLPGLTGLLEALEGGVSWVRENKDFVTGFFIAVGGVVAAVYVPAMLSAAVTTLILAAPVMFVVAAVTAFGVALALVYDDIVNFMRGNDSLLGSFVRFVTQSKPFLAFVDGIGAAFDSVVRKIELFMMIARAAAGLWDKFTGAAAAKVESAVSATVSMAQSALGTAGASPIAAQTSNSVNAANTRNSNKSVSIGKVEVVTQATDAQGVASGLSGGISSQMQQALSQFDDGVQG